MNHLIQKIRGTVCLSSGWENSEWKNIRELEVANFRPESSSHRPQTQVKLRYEKNGLYGLFKVQDKYVRCINTEFQSPVSKDSCVEFFAQPQKGQEYINFEFNCGGALLCNYVEDPTREKGGPLKKKTPLTKKEVKDMEIYHSMPSIVEPEIKEVQTWYLGFYIPFSIFNKYFDLPPDLSGQEWHCNFYKCADNTSHPHWGSWAPVSELNFHKPSDFGTVIFE